ncbi:MAG: hypothetical protein Q4C70_02340 [Planctomycetia bacterium]|nr:hypothetical protein [Planctomycetia bacterium]
MKRTNRWILWLLAPVLFCVMMGYACAEEEDAQNTSKVKKVFTLSFASYNQFINEMKIIGNVASNPAFAATIDGPIRFYFGNDIMKAANLDGQIGLVVLVTEDGNETFPILVLPIADTDVLIDFMTAKDEDLEYTVREDGVVEWENGFLTMYLKVVNEWTYLTLNEEHLPIDKNTKPEDILGPMNGEMLQMYFDFENLSMEMKGAYVDALKDGMELALEQEENESDEDFALRKEVAEAQMKSIRDMMESLTTFSWGIHVDTDTKAIKTTLNINMKPESEFLKLVKKLDEVNPAFSGFAQASGMFRGYGISVNTPENLKVSELALKKSFKDIRNSLEDDKDDKYYAPIMELLNLAEELASSMHTDVQNSGFMMDAEAGNYNMILAMKNQKRETVREMFQKCVALAKKELGDDFDENWVKTDVKTENGLVFDTLTLTTDAINTLGKKLDEEAEELTEKDLELVKKIIGEQFSLIVGGNDTQVWVGLGTDPLAKVTACTNHEKVENVGEIRMDLRSIFAFIEQYAKISVERSEYEIEKLMIAAETTDAETTDAAEDTENAESSEAAETTVAEESESDSENISQALVEELAEIEEESPSEREDALQESIENAEKMQMQMGVLMEIMDGTDETDMVFEVDTTEKGMVIQMDFEEGITRILGMLPSLIMMNAM